MPDGGLFDLESRQQIDIWDAMPAATEADGRKLFATYDDLVADADRYDGGFGSTLGGPLIKRARPARPSIWPAAKRPISGASW